MDRTVKTVCPYCGVGCGIVITTTKEGQLYLSGDSDHPANYGRLCSKGVSLLDTIGLDTRLLHPTVNGQRVEWKTAINEVASRIRSTIDENGPNSFAFYLSGQMLTEDYYAANKLAKGFLGTANVDTNSRLCMASAVSGHRRAFGADIVPGCYADLEHADLVVLVGSNLAWCHPVLFQRLVQIKESCGTRIVVVDPRWTETCNAADLHVAIPSGQDVALFNQLLVYLARIDRLDLQFISSRTKTFIRALESALAEKNQLPLHLSEKTAKFFSWFATTERVVTVFSQGVNQSFQGTDKVNAIINVHLATGRIGRPGMGPFSITGQPNAMGGREVGSLSDQLVAHMGFDRKSVSLARHFWQSPHTVATHMGLKAIDLFRAVHKGQVKVLWIVATNPSVSLPETDSVREALDLCPVVIISDCVANTDSLQRADICLPALAWGEKDGTVTGSDRTISRQRPFLSPPGEARADWQIISDVAKALGYTAAFSWKSPAEIFNEYARLTAFENNGDRALNLTTWIGSDYSNLTPRHWGAKRFFAQDQFFHKDGYARFVAIQQQQAKEKSCCVFPLYLNSGRYRDQWHSMTRTGLSDRLFRHRSEPLLEIHPGDAAEYNLIDDELAQVKSRYGDYIARVRLTVQQQQGEIFLPIHWNDSYAAHAIVSRLYPAYTDPLSGQPELKRVPVCVKPYPIMWWGTLICRDIITLPQRVVSWWVRHPMEGLQFIELAGTKKEQILALVRILQRRYGSTYVWVINKERRPVESSWMKERNPRAILFLEKRPREINLSWFTEKYIGQTIATSSVNYFSHFVTNPSLTVAEAATNTAEEDSIICTCFLVSTREIERAIDEKSLTTVVEIGTVLKASTGCGSCIPELKDLLRRRMKKNICR